MNFRLTIILLLIFGAFSLSANGIEFEKSFEKAMARAAKENKIIFMDAYTTWCGPCKMMDKKVFNQKEVGEYFNENFIPLKMDMEKGEGPALAKKYYVFAYPTLLFIDRFGKVIHRVAGFRNQEQMLALGKEALDPSKQSGSLADRYEAGDRDPKFLLDYAVSMYDSRTAGYQDVTHEFLKTQDDWNNEINLKLIFKMTENVDSPMFDYMINNQDQFLEYVDQNRLKGRIDNLIYSSIYSLGEEPDFKRVDEIFAKAYPERAEEMATKYKIRHYAEKGDVNAFSNTAATYIKKFKVKDWEELNEISWNFYESVDDRKMLKKAVKWTKCSIKHDANYYNHDTLASLYYKLNNKKKALKAANKALAFAKKEGEDPSTTENLLKEIQKL